jgi:NADPH-dependent 2,4-dienoyl-CoA reductase/sulfur reductase-like enzyme
VSRRPGLAVVGASLAGVRTVQALRRRGYDAPVTLIGAEPELPGDRPPLSKDFLLGKVTAEDIALTSPQALAALDVQLLLGTEATGLDLARREVLLGAQRWPYDTVVIATGARPRLLPGTAASGAGPSGAVPAGVHPLRTLADAEAIRVGLVPGARVAVVGGGFIGAEVASAARLLGLDVTIVDPLPVLMARALGPQLGAVLARRHADHGVRLRLGRGVARTEGGGGRIARLVLDDGSAVEADLVVVGIGAEPAVDWLAGSGLDVAGGVAVDARLRAAPGVYAAGDVARWGRGAGQRRFEHWTSAVDQAAALAGVLTGSWTAYDPQPYVWSDQLGSRLQVWGEVLPGDEIGYTHGSADDDEFVAVSGRDGRLAAVVAWGARQAAMRAVKLLRAGTAWVPGLGPVGPSAR